MNSWMPEPTSKRNSEAKCFVDSYHVGAVHEAVATHMPGVVDLGGLGFNYGFGLYCELFPHWLPQFV